MGKEGWKRNKLPEYVKLYVRRHTGYSFWKQNKTKQNKNNNRKEQGMTRLFKGRTKPSGIKTPMCVKMGETMLQEIHCVHEDVIKWTHFPRYWPFVRGIHRSPVNYPHKGQWRRPLMFSLICDRINGWVNNGQAGDLGRHRAHYDVIVMLFPWSVSHVLP